MRGDTLTSWCVVLIPAILVGESRSWAIERNVAASRLETWPVSRPGFVAVFNQKEEEGFFLCWSPSSVMWKRVLEENQQEGSEDFERLDLWISACWGNTVGRGQWHSVTLLLCNALWCCRICNGFQFSQSPREVIFNPNVALLTYISWPKGRTSVRDGSPFLQKCLEKVSLSSHLFYHKGNDHGQSILSQPMMVEMVLCLHHAVTQSCHRFRMDCVLLTAPRSPYLVSDVWDFQSKGFKQEIEQVFTNVSSEESAGPAFLSLWLYSDQCDWSAPEEALLQSLHLSFFLGKIAQTEPFLMVLIKHILCYTNSSNCPL